MGLKWSPDIAQAIKEIILAGVDDADVYINDECAFSKEWGQHV